MEAKAHGQIPTEVTKYLVCWHLP